jgi:hypothetical protein
MKKADNFDASKWLVENKITTQSKLNEGIVSAPLANILWKLNPKVKEWENISSTKEALSFIKSLTNEELNNLYAWRLGFDIPQSEDEKIKNLLDLIDNKIGESKLNEDEAYLSPSMQKQFNMIVSALKKAKSQEDIDQVHSNLMLLPKKLTKIFIDKLVNMGLANREGEGKYSLDYDDGLDESKLDEGKVKNQYVVKDEEESDEYGDFYVIDKKKAFEYLKQFDKRGSVNAKQFIKDDEGWGEFEQYLEDVELMSDKELEDAMREDMSFYYFSTPDELGESK